MYSYAYGIPEDEPVNASEMRELGCISQPWVSSTSTNDRDSMMIMDHNKQVRNRAEQEARRSESLKTKLFKRNRKPSLVCDGSPAKAVEFASQPERIDYGQDDYVFSSDNPDEDQDEDPDRDSKSTRSSSSRSVRRDSLSTDNLRLPGHRAPLPPSPSLSHG